MNPLHISLIHPTGNPNSREVAVALWEIGLLSEVFTTIAYNPESWLVRCLSQLPSQIFNPINRELARRTWIPPAGVPIRSYPWQEVLRVILVKTGLRNRLGIDFQSLVDWVYASLDLHVAKHHLQGLDAVYAYEDGAATTFHAAKQKGLLCLYDLPIVFYRTSRAIQAQEVEYFPELAPALQAVREPDWKIERKEQEVHLADRIFVASSITKRSLLEINIPDDKITVIPYGAPTDYFFPNVNPKSRFRAVFVGRVGPRKGVHYLLQAWKELKLSQAELLLVGINEFPAGWLGRYENCFRHVSSVPHSQLHEYYHAANVFIFPSLVEGFGLVLLEAMACGIPVITTPHTAAPDILVDGVEGFIVPIRDVEALKDKIEWCYSHPQGLAEMGHAARHKAEQLTWKQYRKKLGDRVQLQLKQHKSL